MAKFIVQHRRGTKTQWNDNKNLKPREGELVIEIDEANSLHKLKIGDGKTSYEDLKYLMAGDEIVTQVLAKSLPRIITIDLNVDDWQPVQYEANPNLTCYKQTLEIDGVTPQTKFNLQPDASQLAEFQKLNLVFVTENEIDNTTKENEITIYSIGDKPPRSYIMQATIVEADVQGDQSKLVGIPVGTPTPQSVIDLGTITDISVLNSCIEEGVYIYTYDVSPSSRPNDDDRITYNQKEIMICNFNRYEHRYSEEYGGTGEFEFESEDVVQIRFFPGDSLNVYQRIGIHILGSDWDWTEWKNVSPAMESTTLEGYGITDAYTKIEIDDILRSIEGATVDQTYSPTSENAQSGKAVAEAIADIQVSGGGVQSDWNEINTKSMAYIQNKPSIPTKFSELQDDISVEKTSNKVYGIDDDNKPDDYPTTSAVRSWVDRQLGSVHDRLDQMKISDLIDDTGNDSEHPKKINWAANSTNAERSDVADIAFKDTNGNPIETTYATKAELLAAIGEALEGDY